MIRIKTSQNYHVFIIPLYYHSFVICHRNLLHIFLRKYPQDFLFQNARPVCLGKDQLEIGLNFTRNPQGQRQ